MRKLLFLFLLFCTWTSINAQNTQVISSIVVGLPKISHVQLGLIKSDFEGIPEIIKAEFVFTDNVMMIETDEKADKPISFKDVEKVLKNYFNVNDIHEKEVVSFKLLKASYNKADKYTLK